MITTTACIADLAFNYLYLEHKYTKVFLTKNMSERTVKYFQGNTIHNLQGIIQEMKIKKSIYSLLQMQS